MSDDFEREDRHNTTEPSHVHDADSPKTVGTYLVLILAFGALVFLATILANP